MWAVCDDALVRIDYFAEFHGLNPGSLVRTRYTDMVYINDREALNCVGIWYGESFIIGVVDLTFGFRLGEYSTRSGFVLRWFKRMDVHDFDLPDRYYDLSEYDGIVEIHPVGEKLKRNARAEKKDIRNREQPVAEWCVKLRNMLNDSFWIVESDKKGFRSDPFVVSTKIKDESRENIFPVPELLKTPEGEFVDLKE